MKKIIFNKKDKEKIKKLENILEENTKISNELGKGNLDINIENNESLLSIKNYLINAKDEEEKRKIEDSQRNWTTEGLAKFADIMRQNYKNLEEFSYEILVQLIKYIKANQGSVFLLEEDSYKLYATHAYDRRKIFKKEIKIGEGLIGACAFEKETIYLNDLPKDYINITSGLGDAPPTNLIIVPLKLDDKVYGILEIASFKTIEIYQREFIEKLSESIASTISNVKINIQTEELLKQSQEQGELLKQQEEEMRQNMEEMQATQEEMQNKTIEMSGVLKALNESSLVVTFDMSGTLLEINNAFVELFGIPSHQMIGKHHSMFTEMSKDKKRYDDFWKELKSGNVQIITENVNLPNGKSFWLKEVYSPILDTNNKPIKIMNIATDITENKEQEIVLKQQQEEMKAQEEELRQNMEEMQAVQEEMEKNNFEIKSVMNAVSNSLAYIEFDSNKKVTDCNDEFTKMTGLPKDNIIGAEHKNFLDEEYVKDGKYKKLWDNLISGNNHKDIFYHKLPKGDFWSQETLTPIFDKDGNIKNVMMFIIDITEQIKMQHSIKEQTEELKASEEELRQNLEEMNAIQDDLSMKKDELENEKEKTLDILTKHKDELDELKSEIELLNVQIKRKDKKIEQLKNQ